MRLILIAAALSLCACACPHPPFQHGDSGRMGVVIYREEQSRAPAESEWKKLVDNSEAKK